MRLKKFIVLLLCLTALQACYKEEAADFDYQEGDVIPMVVKFSSQTDSVVFFLDDVKIGTEYEQPYVHYFRVTKDISSGSHTYTTILYYSIGSSTSGEIENRTTFTVK